MLASRAADNDADRHNAGGGGSGDANVSGRTFGGGSGFGMLGAAAAQSSRYVGMAFGYYGLAWSVYSSVIARGGEVQFDKNAVMDIKFGSRRSEEHTSELQSLRHLVCRLLLEKNTYQDQSIRHSADSYATRPAPVLRNVH